MKRVLGIVLLGASSLAFGQGYVGGGLGPTSVSISDCGIQGFSCSTDDKSTGFKLFAGYEFNRIFSVEGGYVNFGQFKQKANGSFNGTQVTVTGTADGDGLFADTILSAPVGSSVSVFGRLGMTVWNVKEKAQASGGGRSASASDNASGISSDFGVGVKVVVTQKISLRGELQRFFRVGDKDKTGQSDVDMISASVLYRF
jgi:OOP family OmpA-OmpF porin